MFLCDIINLGTNEWVGSRDLGKNTAIESEVELNMGIYGKVMKILEGYEYTISIWSY